MRSRLPGATMFAIAWLALVVPGCGTSSSGVASTDASRAVATPDVKADVAARPQGAASPAIEGDRLANVASMPANPNIPQESSPFRFAEITKQAGIDFVHFSGMTVERHFPSANGSGLAVFDYDGDGKMD